MTQRILLVEDDRELAALTAAYLSKNGYKVDTVERGDRVLTRVAAHPPDLVVLDWMLPGLDGLSVCRTLRPVFSGRILMLTAREDEIDEIVGLEVGADDYLTKPIRPRLLLARIRSLLRREEPTACSAFERGALRIDPATRTASIQGEAIELTTAEWDLLHLLARHAGETLDRDRIYLELRGSSYDGIDRSVDLRVSRLRRKLSAAVDVEIKSVRGVGYLLALTR
jgi:two-component system, OmpR family, response regulator